MSDERETLSKDSSLMFKAVKWMLWGWVVHYFFTIASAGSAGLNRFLSDCDSVVRFCSNCLGAI